MATEQGSKGRSITITLHPEEYAKVAELAADDRRSIANMGTILMGEALTQRAAREERGRKKRTSTTGGMNQ